MAWPQIGTVVGEHESLGAAIFSFQPAAIPILVQAWQSLYSDGVSATLFPYFPVSFTLIGRTSLGQRHSPLPVTQGPLTWRGQGLNRGPWAPSTGALKERCHSSFLLNPQALGVGRECSQAAGAELLLEDPELGMVGSHLSLWCLGGRR